MSYKSTILVVSLAVCGSLLSIAQSERRPTEVTQSKPVAVTISGKVREKRSGNPIPNALVRAHIAVWIYQGTDMFEKCPAAQTTSDANGEYRLEITTPLTSGGLMQGKDGLCVSASAPGFETLPQYGRDDVTTQNHTFSGFDFELDEGKRIHGAVVNASGQPIKDAVVRVQNGFNGDWNFFGSMGRTVTGADGSFELWVGDGKEYLDKHPWICILKQGEGYLAVHDILTKEDLGILTLDSGGEVAGV